MKIITVYDDQARTRILQNTEYKHKLNCNVGTINMIRSHVLTSQPLAKIT